MTEILFSFIIPVRNREHTICYCLDSILCQAFTCNYEIIVVDDASTDKTPLIIHKIIDISSHQRLSELDFANKFPESLAIFSKITPQEEYKIRTRVKIIRQYSNVGAAAARNVGINKAVGRYIWFVDSDDFISRNALSVLKAKILKENFDILKFAKQSLFSDTPPSSYKLTDSKKIPRLTYIKDIKGLLFILGHGAVWCSIFNRYFIGNIRFNPSFAYSEDSVFSWQLSLSANKIAYLDYPLYGYMFTQGSLTSIKPKIRFECYLRAVEEYLISIQSSLKVDKEKKVLLRECEKRLYFHAFYSYDFHEISSEMWNVWYAVYENVMIKNPMRSKYKRMMSMLLSRIHSERLFIIIFYMIRKLNFTYIM